MQLTGLDITEAQKCLYWIEQNQDQLTKPVNDLIRLYGKGVASTLLD